MEVYVLQFVLFLLILARVTSVMFIAPIVGHTTIPPQLKIGLSIFLAFILYGGLAGSVSAADVKLGGLVILAMQEIVTGLMIGFLIGIVFSGIRAAGDLISTELGFSMSQMYDPESGHQTMIVGELMYIMAASMFLIMNGHHFIIQSVALSYRAVPLGGLNLSLVLSEKVIAMTGMLFIIAIKFSAPVLVASFLANVVLAILSKVMPQLNLFGIMFSFKIGVGAAMLAAITPVMIFVFKKVMTAFQDNLYELIRLM